MITTCKWSLITWIVLSCNDYAKCTGIPVCPVWNEIHQNVLALYIATNDM